MAEQSRSGLSKRIAEPYQRWKRTREMIAEARAYHAEHDPQLNAESRLPDDEEVHVQSIWIAEVYTPSKVPGLLRALARLGWDKGDSRGALEKYNIAEWVRSGRGSSLGGAWMNLSAIVRPGEGWLMAREAPLPGGIKFATAGLHSLTPSITVACFQFILDEEKRSNLTHVLQRDFHSRIERTKRSYRFADPKNLKLEALREARHSLRAHCWHWFQENLPGIFADGLANGSFPTLDLLTTETAIPFDAPHGQVFHMWALGLDHEMDAWAFDQVPDLRLRMPRTWDESEEATLVLSVRKADFFANKERLSGYGEGDEALCHWLAHRIEGNLVMWAARRAIIGYQKRLGDLRDTALVTGESPADAINRLKVARRSLLSTNADAHIVATEILREYEEKLFRPPANTTEFTASDLYKNQSWLEMMRFQTESLAQAVLATEGQVRNMLSTDAAILSGMVNLRLQRSVRLLTIVSILLTLAALALAGRELWPLLEL